MNMIKVIVRSVLSIAVSSLSAPTHADTTANTTGNQLIKICNEKIEADNGDAWIMCAMYVRGISEGLVMGIQLEIVKNNPEITTPALHEKFQAVWSYCAPDNVSSAEAARVVTNFITEHPHDLDNLASALVMGAYINAWPCKPNK
jgi:hypothetical protein